MIKIGKFIRFAIGKETVPMSAYRSVLSDCRAKDEEIKRLEADKAKLRRDNEVLRMKNYIYECESRGVSPGWDEPGY